MRINSAGDYYPRFPSSSTSSFTTLPHRTVSIPRGGQQGRNQIITRSVARRLADEKAQEAARVVDFASHCVRAVNELTCHHHRLLGGFAQWDRAFATAPVLEAIVADIAAQVKGWSSYETKRNAVSVIHDIIDCMLRAGNFFTNEKVKPWGQSLIGVVGAFTADDRERLATEEREGWVGAWKSTIVRAEEWYFEETLRLREAMDILRGVSERRQQDRAQAANGSSAGDEDGYEADSDGEGEEDEDDWVQVKKEEDEIDVKTEVDARMEVDVKMEEAADDKKWLLVTANAEETEQDTDFLGTRGRSAMRNNRRAKRQGRKRVPQRLLIQQFLN